MVNEDRTRPGRTEPEGARGRNTRLRDVAPLVAFDDSVPAVQATEPAGCQRDDDVVLRFSPSRQRSSSSSDSAWSVRRTTATIVPASSGHPAPVPSAIQRRLHARTATPKVGDVHQDVPGRPRLPDRPCGHQSSSPTAWLWCPNWAKSSLLAHPSHKMRTSVSGGTERVEGLCWLVVTQHGRRSHELPCARRAVTTATWALDIRALHEQMLTQHSSAGRNAHAPVERTGAVPSALKCSLWRLPPVASAVVTASDGAIFRRS